MTEKEMDKAKAMEAKRKEEATETEKEKKAAQRRKGESAERGGGWRQKRRLVKKSKYITPIFQVILLIKFK